MGTKISSVWSDRVLGDSQALGGTLELLRHGNPRLYPSTPPSTGEPFTPGTQSGGLQNDDYHIALIPRENRESGPFPRRSPTKDQFLVLPLTWRQLLNRLEQNIKRSRSTEKQIVEFGNVCVNFATMEVRRLERPIKLTRQQFKLLKFLTLAPRQVFSRDLLLNQVWGFHHYPSTRTVDNHILVLRQKLESSPAHPVHFLTVHGIGYKFIP